MTEEDTFKKLSKKSYDQISDILRKSDTAATTKALKDLLATHGWTLDEYLDTMRSNIFGLDLSNVRRRNI